VLTAEREGEDVIERFGAVTGFADEAFEAPHEILHGGTRCDVAKEITPENAIFREPRQSRFIAIVVFDVSAVIHRNQAER